MTEANYQDSTGKPIGVGDRVRFRGRELQIAEFLPGRGRSGTAGIRFTEQLPEGGEMPDELSVDLLSS